MPDKDGYCSYCHHDEMHHVWPGCDFQSERQVEFIPGLMIWVKTCGCACFDQPGHSDDDKPSAHII